MKSGVALLFQVVIMALGIVILAALLWEPWLEGVNANATSLYDIYFDDPFLAYIYLSFIVVFIGLYQAFRLVGNFGHEEIVSQNSRTALRSIRYCALVFASLIFAAVVYIVMAMRGKDDITGGVAVSLFFIVSSLVVAAAVTLFERKLRKKIQIH